ncbi:MAG TPA: hypothetical protein VM582_09565, partial [Candidatus Thermoplasmatota archaeon]|nr:hypothetical protein [Candidatus Thermoplasmatota archaeon]
IEAPGVWSTADGDTGFNGPVALTLDDTLRSAALSPAERRLMMRVFVTAAMTPAAGTQRRFTKLASIGSHGLTLRAIPGEPPGVYASDVLAHALPIIAPDLAFTTGADGTIKPTTYAIPHLVFDGTDGADVTLEVNKYHWWDWAVWEGRAFHFNEPGTTTPTWEARLSEGAHLQLEGDDAQGQYNGVVAYFTDPNGRRRSVGPPATNWPGSVARCDVTDATLMDLGETNPVTARGKRRWARMDISTVTTDAGAIQIAGAWLATRALPTRRGTVTLTGMVRHPTMGLRPAWAVRAGDYIRVSDHPADVPRKVIETRYDHDMLTMTCTTDNTVGLVDALLERVGVSIIGAL